MTLREHSAHDLTKTYDCRIVGCAQTAQASRGTYAYLCPEHIADKKRKAATARQDAEVARLGLRPPSRDLGLRPPSRDPAESNGRAALPEQITKLMDDIEDARRVVEELKDELRLAVDEYLALRR